MSCEGIYLTGAHLAFQGHHIIAASGRFQDSMWRCMRMVRLPAAVAATGLRCREQLLPAQVEGPNKRREAVQRSRIRCEQCPGDITPPCEQVTICRQPQQQILQWCTCNHHMRVAKDHTLVTWLCCDHSVSA
jgi:hypothetical protein